MVGQGFCLDSGLWCGCSSGRCTKGCAGWYVEERSKGDTMVVTTRCYEAVHMGMLMCTMGRPMSHVHMLKFKRERGRAIMQGRVITQGRDLG